MQINPSKHVNVDHQLETYARISVTDFKYLCLESSFAYVG